jgi:hypothetical protein
MPLEADAIVRTTPHGNQVEISRLLALVLVVGSVNVLNITPLRARAVHRKWQVPVSVTGRAIVPPHRELVGD